MVFGKGLRGLLYFFRILKIGQAVYEKIACLSNLRLNGMLQKRRDSNNENFLLCFLLIVANAEK